jgi:uncharacterized cupredoxin-like copper-binding protein
VNRLATAVGAVVVGAAVTAGALGAQAAAAPERRPVADRALGPGLVTVTVDIEHSHFSLGDLRVHRGTVVRFVVRNHDPIAHELVVGPAAVHRRLEAADGVIPLARPGLVSVEAQGVGVTFYRFDRVGEVEYACHRPDHRDYGMLGAVTVESAARA